VVPVYDLNQNLHIRDSKITMKEL